MTDLWHSAAGDQRWDSPHATSHLLESTTADTMPVSKRILLIALGAVVLCAGIAAVVASRWISPSADVSEVGVVFPGTNERRWVDFVAGVKLAAKRLDLDVSTRREAHECLVELSPKPVLFRWYPDVGTGSIHRRVTGACTQSQPPVALVGAHNSVLTLAIAEALADCPDPDRAPVLLMTEATKDDLIDIHAERSFRFGFNNSHQAKTVVDRLVTYFADEGFAKAKVRAIIVDVVDDPFSVDLAHRYNKSLTQAFGPIAVAPPAEFAGRDPLDPDGPYWSLTTSTGRYEDPNPEEWDLARATIDRMAENPRNRWVLVLPVTTTPFRRFTHALEETLRTWSDPDVSKMVREHLVLLSGDSTNYHSFREVVGRTPAPFIFFDHVNPIDPSIVTDSDRSIPTRSLNREVAFTLLSALKRLGKDATPTTLAEELEHYVPPGATETMFQDGDRREGGGAIVVVPSGDFSSYEMILPPHWQ
ncbi:hypothetical protein Pan216_00200 [Planctomycetes bacterium Pan216]|uniref:Receptor family ligand binding region n=1 Tax=Kolteria novifilia TaxID=2527975 RepID=A0A518AWU6_9BACT|nr:hypothetical protein Pan216_00200 [Planctomycetes bacterium Pan216]